MHAELARCLPVAPSPNNQYDVWLQMELPSPCLWAPGGQCGNSRYNKYCWAMCIHAVGAEFEAQQLIYNASSSFLFCKRYKILLQREQ